MFSLQLAKLLKGKHYGLPRSFKGVSIDSRTIKGGELFIPLTGSKFDGHTFIGKAIERGAVGFLFEKGRLSREELQKLSRSAFAIEVKDTFSALKEIARLRREEFRGREIIAITGTAGKTTTKELIAHLLSYKFDVYKSPKNLNSQIGLPLALANADPHADYWIFELGASERGNIKGLTELLKPTFGVITSIGKAHLEGFGNFESLLCAKGEIFLPQSVKKAVLPIEVSECYKALLKDKKFLATRGNLNYRFTKDGRTEIHLKRFKISVPLLGIGLVRSVETAVKVLELLNLPVEDFAEAFETFKGEWGRMQPLLGDEFLVINDAYNANPLSTKLAVETSVKVEGYSKRVVVLGDMLELGKEEKQIHRELGRFLDKLPLDEIYLYGNLTGFTCEEIKSKKCYHFEDKKLLKEFLRKRHPQKGTVYLIKGSRGMKMEELLEVFKF
jgi:UDP-N-acetylmuramoyl-tripeptide--D-alanyl-D-alanine ligase